jgi:preprotein translocase subunit SecY
VFKQIIQFFSKAVKSKDIRRKLIVTAVILVVFRLVGHIPASGIDRSLLSDLFEQSPLLY